MKTVKAKIPTQKKKEVKIEEVKTKKEAILEDDKIITPEVEELKHEEFRDSIKPEPHEEKVSKENIEKTEFIDIDSKVSDAEPDNNVKVNFMNNNFMEDFISKETEDSKKKENDIKKEDLKDKSGTKQTNDTIAPDLSSGNDFSKDDFADFAEVFMDIIDMGLSTALRFWSKDTSTTAYEVPSDKKRRLVRQLTNLFMKYQAKFSLEFMFIITLLICYSVPFQKAQERRKLINAGITPDARTGGKPKK